MLSRNIKLENFKNTKISKKLITHYKKLINEKNNQNNLINSFTKSYPYSYSKQQLIKYKKYNVFQIFGMGGSSLGSKAIYNKSIKEKKTLNIIISKSGNTLETIVNENILSGKNKLYITENQNNYLRNQALKLKSEIINHKNYIGGRYSVLSEVGMVPAELMGLNSNKFKRFDKLISNKSFVKNLLNSVNVIYNLANRKKTNSVILNYDKNSDSIFKWYQQLVAESLGKSSKGILPIISEMPKDNHSTMQLYLDGNKNSFFTFFDVKDSNSPKLNNKALFGNFGYLKRKSLQSIKYAQKQATKNVFKKKNIPFRSFAILKRNEETIGELFTFFMLETILLGKMMKINPFDQPAVELIKKETKKLLD